MDHRKKPRLFPYTKLTGWFLQSRPNVYCAVRAASTLILVFFFHHGRPSSILGEIHVGQSGTESGTSVSPVIIIPTMLQTHSFIYDRRFSPSTSVSPVSILPPMLHTHSFIYHRRCIMFFPNTSVFLASIIPPMLHTHSFIHLPPTLYKVFSKYFSFPCQYHSTNAPYSFIHLPPTLYNVFSQYFSFPSQYHSTNAPYQFIRSTRCSYYGKRANLGNLREKKNALSEDGEL